MLVRHIGSKGLHERLFQFAEKSKMGGKYHLNVIMGINGDHSDVETFFIIKNLLVYGRVESYYLKCGLVSFTYDKVTSIC